MHLKLAILYFQNAYLLPTIYAGLSFQINKYFLNYLAKIDLHFGTKLGRLRDRITRPILRVPVLV